MRTSPSCVSLLLPRLQRVRESKGLALLELARFNKTLSEWTHEQGLVVEHARALFRVASVTNGCIPEDASSCPQLPLCVAYAEASFAHLRTTHDLHGALRVVIRGQSELRELHARGLAAAAAAAAAGPSTRLPGKDQKASAYRLLGVPAGFAAPSWNNRRRLERRRAPAPKVAAGRQRSAQARRGAVCDAQLQQQPGGNESGDDVRIGNGRGSDDVGNDEDDEADDDEDDEAGDDEDDEAGDDDRRSEPTDSSEPSDSEDEGGRGVVADACKSPRADEVQHRGGGAKRSMPAATRAEPSGPSPATQLTQHEKSVLHLAAPGGPLAQLLEAAQDLGMRSIPVEELR